MAEQFYLTFTQNPELVVQAGTRAGRDVTLAPLELGNAQQLWILEPQNAAGFSGVAFVNPATGNSIFYQGAPGLPLIMQPYKAGTDGMDAWYVTPGSGRGDVQLTLPTNPQLHWQSLVGTDHITVGPTPAGPGGNSAWNFKLATPTPLAGVDAGEASGRVAVPSIAGEPAGAAD